MATPEPVVVTLKSVCSRVLPNRSNVVFLLLKTPRLLYPVCYAHPEAVGSYISCSIISVRLSEERKV